MYMEFEKPLISASIFYYDIEYDQRTSRRVLEILQKNDLYPPEKINADKLTKNRFVYANEKTQELFVRAYSEEDVFSINMASGDSRKVNDYWQVFWSFTFYKWADRSDNGSFLPWNVLRIYSTYGRLRDDNIYNQYFQCVKELIEELNPFYVSIDDLANKTKLLDKAFKPEQIQEIYWGNYFGERHCDNYGLDKILNIPAFNVEKIGKGVFFTLTDSVFDFSSPNCVTSRKRIKRVLQRKK